MNQETAVVRIIEETANNIKKAQFLMNCPIDLCRERALNWKINAACSEIKSLPEYCPTEKTTCSTVKEKPTIKVINPNC